MTGKYFKYSKNYLGYIENLGVKYFPGIKAAARFQFMLLSYLESTSNHNQQLQVIFSFGLQHRLIFNVHLHSEAAGFIGSMTKKNVLRPPAVL